jgi:uncharacterized protein (TIGR02996 family)
MQLSQEEADFRQSLGKRPNDDSARQIFADWLEDHGRAEARIGRSDWRVLPAPPSPNYYPELQIDSLRYGRRSPGEFMGTVNKGWLLYFPPESLMYEGQAVLDRDIIHRYLYKPTGWNRDARGNPIRCHRLDAEIGLEGFAAMFP